MKLCRMLSHSSADAVQNAVLARDDEPREPGLLALPPRACIEDESWLTARACRC